MKLARDLQRQRIDLLHGSDVMGGYRIALAAQLARRPILCHVRSNFPHDDLPRHHKLPLLAIDRFLFCSRATWENFNHIFHVGIDRGTVVYDWPPLAPGAPEPDAESSLAIRRSFGIPEGATVFSMVARVAPQKDFETLLTAFAQVVRRNDRVRLLLVGEYLSPAACRTYWEQLCRIVQDEGLVEHVIWAGFRSDVTAILNASDAIVLCTHSEGMPLTVLEAMGAGRLVIATRVGGIAEAITDGQTGLLHEHGDSDGLADCMLQVVDNRPLSNELAARAKARAAADFSESRTVDDVSAVYRRTLASSNRFTSGRHIARTAASEI
jgi:glycosyltransferase involved in cell wall biosynthesis